MADSGPFPTLIADRTFNRGTGPRRGMGKLIVTPQ